MSFLTPLFLLGGLAVALPVVFHLIRRTTRQRTVFSSLMFLQPTPPRLTRRNRLEHLFLLLLRCAALCLLATGFARPFLKEPLPQNPSATPTKRTLILVDTSASMRRENLWSQARDKADAILRLTSPADHVALYTFDRQLTPLITFDQWDSMAVGDRAGFARGRLAETKPGWSATRLDQALVRASELLAETESDQAPGAHQIVLISDFQEGSKLSALQGQEWPKGVEVVSERVAVKGGNAGLQLLADTTDSQPTSAAAVRVRVNNDASSKHEQFQVGWASDSGRSAGKALEVYVPAGQSRVVALPAPTTNSSAEQITLRGDDETFDNVVFTSPPEAVRIKVLYIGNDAATDSRQPQYFLRRALQETSRQQIEVMSHPASTPLTADETTSAALFIATEALPESLAGALREQLTLGKTLLFAPANAAAASTLGLLLGLKALAAEEGVVGNYAMLGEIDFRHPLFAPFVDPRYSDFTKIHFWKYRRLDAAAIPSARVIARFDNGDPAIADIPVGRGRVVFFASGWQPADSQLSLSSKFVPLLFSLLDLSGGAPASLTQYSVGDTVPLPADWMQNGGETAIVCPDGSSLKFAAGETNFTGTSMPGIYRVKAGTTEKRFAVNLDAAESRTAPLPLDELDRLGVPAPKTVAPTTHEAERKTVLQSTELENRQKLWRWFVVATLAVLLIETCFAGWTARAPKVEVAT